MMFSRIDVGIIPNYLGGSAGNCLIRRSASGWLGLADNAEPFVPDTTVRTAVHRYKALVTGDSA